MPFPTRAGQLDSLKLPWTRASDLPHGKTCKVSQIVKEYLLSERYRGLSRGSKKAYLSALKYFELLILANSKTIFQQNVNQVTYGTVDYLKSLLLHNHSPATARHYFTIMSGVWELAIRNGRCYANPWVRPMIKLNNERDVTWTPQQLDLAVQTAKDMGFTLLALYLTVSYETAQRPWKDLRNLKWSNVVKDDTGATILDFVISKTGVHLLLPLSDAVINILNGLPKNSEYVFVDEQGVRLTQSGLVSQYKKVKKYAMLSGALQIRDLRRSAITEMAMAGATVQEIEASTGWKCSEYVIRRYARLRLATAKHGLEKRTQFRKELEVKQEPVAEDGLPFLQRDE